jgi:hypothetical protein
MSAVAYLSFPCRAFADFGSNDDESINPNRASRLRCLPPTMGLGTSYNSKRAMFRILLLAFETHHRTPTTRLECCITSLLSHRLTLFPRRRVGVPNIFYPIRRVILSVSPLASRLFRVHKKSQRP